MISALSPAEKAQLDKTLATELRAKWLPTPGPQAEACYSKADLLLFGGSAGGGKTDALVGLAMTQHKRAVIFRRAYVDLRGIEERLVEINGSRDGYNGHDMVFKREGRLIEFGALEKPGAESTWQGRPHDFIGFDEGAQLSAAKVSFVMGWLRTTAQGQRCRVVIASNPPMGGEGDWLLEWFAPWLDPLFPDPAQPGELRWVYIKGEEIVWVDGPGSTEIDDQTFTHLSRTFIPSFLADNPYLRDTGYRAQLESLPEPLRSQLLKGDFLAGREDHEWQVIPTEWVRLAQERWKSAPTKRRAMIALSCDPASGSLTGDSTSIARLHADCWFAPMERRKGFATDPAVFSAEIAGTMLGLRKDGADLSVDNTGGWGAGVRSHLKADHEIDCAAILFSGQANAKTKDGKLGFKNLRALMYWRLREALDPDEGDDVMLPPDPKLAAQLTTPRYKLKGTDILIEDKDEIRKRVGSSPDDADSVVMAWHRRHAAVKSEKTEALAKRLSKPLPGRSAMGVKGPPQGWMGR